MLYFQNSSYTTYNVGVCSQAKQPKIIQITSKLPNKTLKQIYRVKKEFAHQQNMQTSDDKAFQQLEPVRK